MLATGHEVEVFTSEPAKLKGELDCKISDVQEVMQENILAETYRKNGAFAYYSDMVRLELLRHDLGTWSDLDCLFLKPLIVESDYVFGLCGDNRINNALLRLPADSEILHAYHAAVNRVPIRAPWATYHIQVKREIEILLGKKMPYNPNKMSIGPRALTWFLKKHKLLHHAQALPVFYPITQEQTAMLRDPDDRAIQQLIKDETISIHAWRSNWMAPHIEVPLPPKTSLLGQLIEKCGR
jgi:hypothetical protein